MSTEAAKWIFAYLAVMTVAAFIFMGIDKSKAKNHRWRISEAALFLLGAFGGALGGIAGMLAFNHKTAKWYFVLFFPLMMAVHFIILYNVML